MVQLTAEKLGDEGEFAVADTGTKNRENKRRQKFCPAFDKHVEEEAAFGKWTNDEKRR